MLVYLNNIPIVIGALHKAVSSRYNPVLIDKTSPTEMFGAISFLDSNIYLQ